MRRLGFVAGLLVAFGCATAEPVTDEPGVGGAASGGSGPIDGKVDNPNDGGAGGAGNEGGTATGGGGVAGNPAGGTSAGGGAPGGGGTTSGGGGTTSGGGGTTSGGGSGGGCSAGLKQCGGVCIAPSPGIGCGPTGCTACPNPPANANSICTGTLCDFQCLSGYTKQGNTCVGGPSGGGGAPSGGGGTTGSGGGSGCPAPCDPSDPTAQFLCNFFCIPAGKVGLCAPVINCCTCL